jgi:hypothetical protein
VGRRPRLRIKLSEGGTDVLGIERDLTAKAPVTGDLQDRHRRRLGGPGRTVLEAARGADEG